MILVRYEVLVPIADEEIQYIIKYKQDKNLSFNRIDQWTRIKTLVNKDLINRKKSDFYDLSSIYLETCNSLFFLSFNKKM